MLAALPVEPADALALFTQTLAAQFVGPAAPLAAGDANSAAEGRPDTAATPDADADAEAGVAEAFLAMLGLPVVAKGESVPAGKPAGAALLAGVDAQAGGKKLPNQAAVVAGLQQNLSVQANLDAKAELPPGLAVMAEKVLLGGDAAAAADKPALLPGAPVVASTAPPAGQETALMAVRSQTAATPDKPVIVMQSPFGGATWAQELGDRMVWLAGQRGHTAELVLNPPSLGAVEVRIQMSGSDANAQFFSANPVVRETLEAALPKLREMLDTAGISLGDASVSQQSLGRRDQAGQDGSAKTAFAETDGEGQIPAGFAMSASPTGLSLLDYYA
jgi:flagellar hook-length control protein FliK